MILPQDMQLVEKKLFRKKFHGVTQWPIDLGKTENISVMVFDEKTKFNKKNKYYLQYIDNYLGRYHLDVVFVKRQNDNYVYFKIRNFYATNR